MNESENQKLTTPPVVEKIKKLNQTMTAMTMTTTTTTRTAKTNTQRQRVVATLLVI